jgi:hypothetical protein
MPAVERTCVGRWKAAAKPRSEAAGRIAHEYHETGRTMNEQQNPKLSEEQHKQLEAHNRATAEFIQLANKLAAEEDQDVKIVSAALMAASGIYATFITAGNEGFLGPGGVDRIAEVYKNNLGYIQERKKQELKAAGKEVRPVESADGEPLKTPHAEQIRKAEEGDGE